MSDHVFYVFEVAIKPGQIENFEAVMKEMVEATRANEPGTLNYEWFVADDGTSCHIYERYADSAALVAHLGAVRQSFSERFFQTIQPVKVTLYGNPDDRVREMFTAMGALFMKPTAGFAR